MHKKPRRGGLVHDTHGDTLVEFALSAVLFFLTIFGIAEFGIAVWQYNTVADLAKEGARWAAVHGAASPAPASGTAVRDYVSLRAIGISGITVTTTPAPSSLNPGDTVTVVVTKTFRPGGTLIPHSAINLQSTARMIMAR
jgi:Flp pilus assembly protein TadG